MAMARALEPTDQQLREAHARMAQRFGWSDSFETVMQDATRSRLVRMAALHPTAAGLPSRRPAPPLRRAARRAPAALPLFDRKRAAAGDRDDD